MTSSRENLLPLCKAADVAPGAVKRVDVEGLPPLAVYNVEGAFYVTDDTCSHGQASLAEGYVEGDEIECPWHGGRFCIRNGEPLGFPVVLPVQSYAATVVDADVCIAPPPKDT